MMLYDAAPRGLPRLLADDFANQFSGLLFIGLFARKNP